MRVNSTVLVVDDDPEVLEVAVMACEDMGLTVFRAADGAGALEILRDNPEVELLLTDIGMPNMTGWELAHAAKQKYPDLKVIYTSGYIKSYPIGEHGRAMGRCCPNPGGVLSFANRYGLCSGGSALPATTERGAIILMPNIGHFAPGTY
jgi:CheY-like chemotaxis protein